jgi:hypothetical protein
MRLTNVAQVSKLAVSPVSKPEAAARTDCAQNFKPCKGDDLHFLSAFVGRMADFTRPRSQRIFPTL